MSQHDLDVANQGFSAFRSDMNAALVALGTLQSGATAPATTFAHMLWADTTTNLLKRRNAANSGWIVVRSLSETFVVSRSSDTILAGSDVGKMFQATAAFTQTLTAAATLGDGWFCAYNAGGFSVVLDPNSSETIDGATTKTVTGSGLIFCNGSSFFTVGFAPTFDAGVNGTARNLKASLTSAGTTVTFTADEVLVETALGGSSQRIASLSQALNISTTGAGGMDTGSAPTSGYLSVYAIAKPDGTKSVLGVNAATSSGSIYSGANMPSGYTYSALIAIWPTNATPNLKPGLVLDRRFNYQAAVNIFTGGTGGALASQSISAAVPTVARTADVQISCSGTSASYPGVAADATGTGLQFAAFGSSTAGTLPGGVTSQGAGATFKDVPIITSQTIYWADTRSGAGTNRMEILGFTI